MKRYKSYFLCEDGKVLNANRFNMSYRADGLILLGNESFTREGIKKLFNSIGDETRVQHAPDKTEHANETRVPEKKVNETRVKDKTQHALTDETRVHYNSRKGQTNGKYIGTFLINGKKYLSAHDAAKELNLSPSTVIRRCKRSVNGFSLI